MDSDLLSVKFLIQESKRVHSRVNRHGEGINSEARQACVDAAIVLEKAGIAVLSAVVANRRHDAISLAEAIVHSLY